MLVSAFYLKFQLVFRLLVSNLNFHDNKNINNNKNKNCYRLGMERLFWNFSGMFSLRQAAVAVVA